MLEAVRVIAKVFFLRSCLLQEPLNLRGYLYLGLGLPLAGGLCTSWESSSAVVEVFDVRSAVKEEAKSLGGKFVEVEGAKEDAQPAVMLSNKPKILKRNSRILSRSAPLLPMCDIATAQIPGEKAPVLFLKETVYSMKPGSVIIDLAASTGGNCEFTETGRKHYCARCTHCREI